jgi:hypothetical protein
MDFQDDTPLGSQGTATASGILTLHQPLGTLCTCAARYIGASVVLLAILLAFQTTVFGHKSQL